MPIFYCAGGKKRWRKSGVFISEKLQPDAGPDAVQGGPARLISSNCRHRCTREGRGPARPIPRGTGASGHAPSGQHVSQCRSDMVARPVMCDRTRLITWGALWTPIGCWVPRVRSKGVARPVMATTLSDAHYCCLSCTLTGASGHHVFHCVVLQRLVAYPFAINRWWPGFGCYLSDSLNTWDILWARELPLHSSPCLVAYSSEIEWDSSALLSDLHQVALDPLSWLWISYYSWVFPDTLDGLEQRWCWAHDWRLFRASPSDYEGFLSLPRGSSWIGYSSGGRGLEDPHLVSGCAAPAESSTLDSWLDRDPSSGCIATTRSSLPGSKWTSVKNLVSSYCRWFHLCMWSHWLIGTLDISLLINIGISIQALFFTYCSLPCLAWVE
jgi:hypothetical protein